MRPRLLQALFALALCGPAAAAPPAPAPVAPPHAGAAAAPSPYHARLAAECDELLRRAVKTRFGWGWKGVEVAPPPPRPVASARPARPARTRPAPAPATAANVVTIDTRTTAAAGLALHLAGRSLGEPKYTAAAAQAARLIAAVQTNTGQVPAAGVVRANAGGADAPALVPSRSATCAGLALMLTLLHDADAPPAADGAAAADAAPDAVMVSGLKPAATRAAAWLATQQGKAGGWLVEYLPESASAAPAAAPPEKPFRLLRLDVPEPRDATYSLWLAASVLDDAKLRRRAETAVEKLIALRIAEEKSPGRNLWSAGYNPDDTAETTPPGFPFRVDTGASHYAMQALLAASLLGDADAASPVLNEAAAALGRLPRREGKWLRHYDLLPAATPAPAAEDPAPPAAAGDDVPPESSVFEPGEGDRSQDREAEETAPPSLDQTLNAVRRLAGLGPESYARALSATVPVEHRLALTVCGLDDDALTAEVPTDAAGVKEYLVRYQGVFELLDGPPPDDPATRVRRLGLLLRRSQLELPEKQPN